MKISKNGLDKGRPLVYTPTMYRYMARRTKRMGGLLGLSLILGAASFVFWTCGPCDATLQQLTLSDCCCGDGCPSHLSQKTQREEAVVTPAPLRTARLLSHSISPLLTELEHVYSPFKPQEEKKHPGTVSLYTLYTSYLL